MNNIEAIRNRDAATGPRQAGQVYADRRYLLEQLADCDREIAGLTKACEIAKAAIWDAHYGKGITIKYVQAVDKELRAALARRQGERETK